jgi:hypothetical protein
MMLSEEISECFSGEFWKRAARLVRNGFYRLPSIIIELDSLTMHGYRSSDTPTIKYIPERRSDELRLLSPPSPSGIDKIDRPGT